MMLVLGHTGTGVEAGTDGCSTGVASLDPDGTASSLIVDEKLHAELGEDVKHCIYTLATEALEEAVGECVVSAVTFEGTEPAPRLFTAIKGWDEIVVQADVTQSGGELAWSWTGDALSCEESGCLDGEVIQVYLIGNDFGLTDGVENCPWTLVQARFELEQAP